MLAGSFALSCAMSFLVPYSIIEQRALMGLACSLPSPAHDLTDALMREAENLSQGGYRLTLLVTGTDFGIACTLGKSAIGDRSLRENQAAIRD